MRFHLHLRETTPPGPATRLARTPGIQARHAGKPGPRACRSEEKIAGVAPVTLPCCPPARSGQASARACRPQREMHPR